MSQAEAPVVYHNPRCSKSRRVLELLRERGLEPRVLEYLKEPLDAAGFLALVRAVARPAHELVRSKEEAYARAGLSVLSSDAELADAVAAEPLLLERPVVVLGERAVLGRPPEAVLELLLGSAGPPEKR